MSTPDPSGTDSQTPTEQGGPDPDGQEPQGAVAVGGDADAASGASDPAEPAEPADSAGSEESAESEEPSAPDGSAGRKDDGAEPKDGTDGGDGAERTDSAVSSDSADGADGADSAHGENGGDRGDRGAQGSRSSVFDLLPSPVFLLILGITAFAGWFSWTRWEETQDLYEYGGTPYAPFVFILGAWIACVAVHEFAHALVAYLSGDRGLRGSGYLRLNPFAYRERRVSGKGETGGGLFTGLLMPAVFVVLGGIGLTGPASYVDRDALGGRGRRILTALAGIVASLVLAAGFAVAVMLLVPAGMVTDNWLIGGLMFLCYLNLTVALVNLLPIPGLDGYTVLVPLLEAATASPRRFEGMERAARSFGLFGTIAVFGVLWFNVVNLAYINAMTGLFRQIGMPQMDIFFGELLMRFWIS
ncbi:site-2 protease family protein [Nocardiopsis halophila]|uniref:site-2 protease family protein n=1 Tax=Nocardiopsis halophila TaxID=141692 RepID=UPI00034B1BA0|nr:site-2 protease family protein [Nocardiopsis halophila]